MNRPSENPLTPASLATGGNQGAEAKAYGPCGSKDNPLQVGSYYVVCVAVSAARAHLAAIADSTDVLHPGLVEAADLLDVVTDRLESALEGIDGLGDTTSRPRQQVT